MFLVQIWSFFVFLEFKRFHTLEILNYFLAVRKILLGNLARLEKQNVGSFFEIFI